MFSCTGNHTFGKCDRDECDFQRLPVIDDYPYWWHQADTREARKAYIAHDESCIICAGIMGPCEVSQMLWTRYRELRQRDRKLRHA